jgi:GTPase SAR1 family protein
MLVYDITSGESFLRVEDWLERIDQNCLREKLTLTLVGNKIDLDHQREVNEEQGIQFASSYSVTLLPLR